MKTRKLRTGQRENGFHTWCREALPEQFFGDPEVHDAPIGLRKTWWNLQPLQPASIDCNCLGSLGCETGRCFTGRSRVLNDRRVWRQPASMGRWRRSEQDRLHQALAVGCQAGGGVVDFDPGRQSAGQAPLWFLVGESGEPSQVAPVGASQIPLIEASQVSADGSCQLGRQRHQADSNPGLKMSRTGLDHGAGFVPVVAHSRQDRGLGAVQIDQNVAGVVVQRVGPEVDIKALPVARAQKSDRGFAQDLSGRPNPLPGEGLRVTWCIRRIR